MVIEITQSTDEIVVDYQGRKLHFAYNPETGYVLLPQSVYQSELALVTALNNEDFIEGVFSHESITDL